MLDDEEKRARNANMLQELYDKLEQEEREAVTQYAVNQGNKHNLGLKGNVVENEYEDDFDEDEEEEYGAN